MNCTTCPGAAAHLLTQVATTKRKFTPLYTTVIVKMKKLNEMKKLNYTTSNHFMLFIAFVRKHYISKGVKKSNSDEKTKIVLYPEVGQFFV